MENGQNLPVADSRVKVLVVDDHPNTANMLARAISRLGSHMDVVSATSGHEALQHIENGAADILITDMMMPEMNGLELIEKLNNEPFVPPTFSYLVTAHDSADFVETAERLSVKKIISKPIHPEAICKIVTEAMEEMKKTVSPKKESNEEKLTTIASEMEASTEAEVHSSRVKRNQ